MKLDQMIGIGRISQVWRFSDMSDGISMVQMLKIMTDLFYISYCYTHRANNVKLKLKTLLDNTGLRKAVKRGFHRSGF